MAVPASLAVLVAALLAGCGDDASTTGTDATATTSTTGTPPPSKPSPKPTKKPSHAHEGVVIEATVRGDELDPNGERVEVPVDEAITIVVDADRAGELHVHSTPDQSLPFEQGVTRLHVDPITTPGIVEVEEHESGKLLVSLEVR